MLIIQRHLGGRIRINNNRTLTVVAITPQGPRLKLEHCQPCLTNGLVNNVRMIDLGADALQPLTVEGETVTLAWCGNNRHQTRIGFDAPRHITIQTEERWQLAQRAA